MATDKERRMLIRPLMKRRPDLAYHRQYVFLRPLTHYLLGVYFCPGRWANEVELATIVMPLFGGWDYVYLIVKHGPNKSGFPFGKQVPGDWKQDPEGTSRWVCDFIEHEAVPVLARLTSPHALATEPGYSGYRWDAILGSCFDGDYDEAERLVVDYVGQEGGQRRRIEDYPGKSWRKPDEYEPYSIAIATEAHKFHEDRDWRLAYLGKVLQTDRARVPALLHDWEAFTVKSLKLDKYWTKTPFPCEGRTVL